MHLDPKALEAAVTASTNAMIRNEPDVEAAIRAYLSASLPKDAVDLVAEMTSEDFRHEMQHLRSSSEIDMLFHRAASLIQSQAARIAELEAGLEPFASVVERAEKANAHFGGTHTSEVPDNREYGVLGVTWGHLRTARALLNRRAEG